MFKKVLTASLLCGLFVWQGAAAPEGDARKAKWAERPKTDRAKAGAGEATSTAREPRPVTSAASGETKEWAQERWEKGNIQNWDPRTENVYWRKTDGIDLAFIWPYVGAAHTWAARQELPMAGGSRFAVPSLAVETSILYGGVGTGANSNTGVVCYTEDREGADWKVSAVKDGAGFTARKVFDVCWTPKPTSGTIFAATGVDSPRTTTKTPLFYHRGVIPSSDWTSVLEYASIPPRAVSDFSAVAADATSTTAEVYLGYSGSAIGAAQVYRFREPSPWELLGTLSNAKDVYSICATDTGFLAGTGPRGYVYEWNKNQSIFTPRRVGPLTDGDIYDVAYVDGYYYAAVGNCAPGDKARLFRTRDLVQWEDVTPRATGVSSLNAFVALSEFGKDGAVAAVGDIFDRLYVSSYPAQASWGVVTGDTGAKARDLVHVPAGSDFWGNFVAYEKDGRVYARKFQGFESGGILYSSVYDSYDKLVEYRTLDVEGPMASGDAKFWLRAAASDGDFKTPDGSLPGEPTWVAAEPGLPLPPVLNKKRYIQYKVQLDVPDRQKFPPVVKKVRLGMFSTYAKVTGTSPVDGTKGHNVGVPIKFFFSKVVAWNTIGPENITLTGKNRTYRWYGFGNDVTCEYVVFHENFDPYDDITVKLESIPRREIKDKDDWEIDPDGDGQKGGTYKFTFGVGAGGGGGEGEGPNVYDVTVQPNPTFGAKEVTIRATADDTKTGNSPIVAAEYSFGPSAAPAGKGEPMDGNFGSPTADVWAEADISEVSRGQTRINAYVRALDKAGNWGDPTTAPIFIRPPEFLPAEYVYFYPNPCREDVGYFHYLVTQDSEVTIRIFDIRGRLVEEIRTTARAYAGERGLRWDVSGVGADVYIVQFTARAFATGEVATVTKKLAVLK